MNKFIYTFTLLLQVFILYSQQQTQFTQYFFNKSEYNPASTATSKAINAFVTTRYQWMGMTDDSNSIVNPTTYLINFEMPIYSIKSGIGLSVNYSHLGVEDNFDIKLNYAFHQPIRFNHVISFGLSFELMNKSIDYSKFFAFDKGDPLLINNDIEKGVFTDFGFGIYYQYKDDFYTGISVSQIIGSSGKIGEVTYDLVPHYYLMAGYNFNLGKDRKSDYVLSTGFLTKTSVAITQFELHMLIRYNDKYWGGLMYRMNDAVGIIAGFNVYNFSFGLSYDVITSSLAKTGSIGTPELFIKYCHPLHDGHSPCDSYY